MRDTIHIVDVLNNELNGSVLNETTFYRSDAIYLDIRKDEKDYFLRHPDAAVQADDPDHDYEADMDPYKNGVRAHVNDFTTSLDGIVELTSNHKLNYSSHLTDYLGLFEDVVNSYINLVTLTGSFRDATHNIETEIDNLIDIVEELINRINKLVEAEVSSIITQTIIVFVITFILGVLLTIWISKRIVAPVVEIERELSNISEGNLTGLFAYSKKPAMELISLGNNVANMKKELLSMIGSIDESNVVLVNTASDFVI